jgi:preprotein translocase subunit SecG
MLKLYRGIVDILTARCEDLNNGFAQHIREFNDGDSNDNNFGVAGFWNLLLEITFVMYVKVFAALGIVLTVVLALLFFPLHALRIAVTNMLNHRAEPFAVDQVEPIIQEQSNGNKKEK